MKATKILVVCPKCGAGGETEGVEGQPVVCPDCATEFRALQPGFWKRQKMRSPVMQMWWLAPAMLVFVLWGMGWMSTLTIEVLVIIALLLGILVTLIRMNEKQTR